MLDEIASHNLQILLDPVNMLSMDNVDRREEVFAETIELLGKDVAMIHFKDFLRQDADGQLKACGAGQGEMGDYSTILRFAKQEKPFVFATCCCPSSSSAAWLWAASRAEITTGAKAPPVKMQWGCCTSPTKRPELFSQKALQLWSFALTLTVQNETDKARKAYRN